MASSTETEPGVPEEGKNNIEFLKQYLEEYAYDDAEKRGILQELEDQSYRITGSDDAKNVRPQLMWDEFAGVGSELSKEDQVLLSAPVEIIHAWTKQLDDIHDHDQMRNGVETPHTLLARDMRQEPAEHVTSNHLLDVKSRAYRPVMDANIPSDTKLNILESIWEAEEDLAQGQNNDILNTESVKNPDFKEDRLAYAGKEYDRFAHMDEINGKKTGVLFRLIGETVEEVEDLETDGLSRYGTALGKAYQVRDNIVDMIADEEDQGREPFSDLREGTYTEPSHIAERYSRSMAERAETLSENAGDEQLAEEYQRHADMYRENAEAIRNVLEAEDPDYDELEEAGRIIMEETPAMEASQNVADYWVDMAIGNEDAEIDGALDDVDWEDEAYRKKLETMAVYAGRQRGK
ncbi:MAG: polyprenyl synthetase family protein [Candidatus Nanohaloarchaea archaeon]